MSGRQSCHPSNTVGSAGCLEPETRPVPSRAEPFKPRRGAEPPRRAPHLLRAARNTCRRGGAVSHYPNSWSRCAVLPRAHQAPRQPLPSPADLIRRAQALRSRARAAGASARTPTARRSVRSPRLAPSDAAPSPEEPRRVAGTPRHTPHLSRAARTTRKRRGTRLAG
jgi:hypothetical protein